MRAFLIAALLIACGPRKPDYQVVALPVEIAQSADGRLALELRDVKYERGESDLLSFYVVVANRGQVTFTTVDVEVELLDATGAVVGKQRVDVVGFSETLGWLYPWFQGTKFWGGWQGDWKRPAKLRGRVVRAEVQRGEPPPEPPKLSDAPLVWTKPPTAHQLDIKLVWGGDGPEGIGPSAGRVAFDVEVAVSNVGTTTVDSIEIAAVFLDDAGKEVDRLGLPGSFQPVLRPGDRRMFGAARGVLAHKSWRLEVGEIRAERSGTAENLPR